MIGGAGDQGLTAGKGLSFPMSTRPAYTIQSKAYTSASVKHGTYKKNMTRMTDAVF